MPPLSVTEKYIAIVRNLQIDLYDHVNHIIVDVPPPAKLEENDHLTSVVVSADNKYLATVTSTSKRLIVYTLPSLTDPKTYSLPRTVSKFRFTVNNSSILVADKTGDALLYELDKEETGIRLLGHLSLLLDILQTNDERFIITSDRDEKIKVSCYPNTYNIQTYCLGHKEYVNHIDLLPHNNKYLLSSSGDGDVRIWNYINGISCHTINTNDDVSDDTLKVSFIKKMDEEKIEVKTLPIVHFSVAKLSDDTSLLALTVHSYNNVLIYSIKSTEDKLTHKLEAKMPMNDFPTALELFGLNLFIYNDTSHSVINYNLTLSNGSISFNEKSSENVFANVSKGHSENTENHFESIKVLFKRKYDNVQEYQERKKQRIQKSFQKILDIQS